MKRYLQGIATGYGIGAFVVLAGGPIYRLQEGYGMPTREEALSGVKLAAAWPLALYVLLIDQ